MEGVVVQELFRYLDGDMELICIQHDLVEGCITEGESAAFLNPRCSRLGRCNVDLVLAAGSDRGAEATHDVLLVQHIDEPVVVFLRNEVAAVLVDAFLQNIADLAEVGAQRLQHTLAVLVRGATGFLFRLGRGLIGSAGDRGVDRLGELLLHSFLPLHSGDFTAHVHDFLLHLVVGCGILIGEDALVGAVGLGKIASRRKCLISSLHQF